MTWVHLLERRRRTERGRRPEKRKGREDGMLLRLTLWRVTVCCSHITVSSIAALCNTRHETLIDLSSPTPCCFLKRVYHSHSQWLGVPYEVEEMFLVRRCIDEHSHLTGWGVFNLSPRENHSIMLLSCLPAGNKADCGKVLSADQSHRGRKEP